MAENITQGDIAVIIQIIREFEERVLFPLLKGEYVEPAPHFDEIILPKRDDLVSMDSVGIAYSLMVKLLKSYVGTAATLETYGLEPPEGSSNGRE